MAAATFGLVLKVRVASGSNRSDCVEAPGRQKPRKKLPANSLRTISLRPLRTTLVGTFSKRATVGGSLWTFPPRTCAIVDGLSQPASTE